MMRLMPHTKSDAWGQLKMRRLPWQGVNIIEVYYTYAWKWHNETNQKKWEEDWGVSNSGRGKVAGKRDMRVNIVQKMHTHVCKCKNIPVETVPVIRGRWG
jgi:hypothetical protein